MHKLYNEFISQYNIKNGELASQQKINESVNILKKETDDIYNRMEIIRGHLAFPWCYQTLYNNGEIVSYMGINYILDNDYTSINEIPSHSYKWKVTTRADWTLDLDPNGYISRNNTDSYMPTEPGNPVVKRYVDDRDEQVYVDFDFSKGVNFIPLNIDNITNTSHITSYVPTKPSDPANKKYIDSMIDNLSLSDSAIIVNSKNSEALGNRLANQFVTLYKGFTGNYNGFAVKNGQDKDSIDSTNWIRTTANGMLPYKPNSESVNETNSALGTEYWKYSEVHALMINGTSVQKFQTETQLENGDVLAVGIDSTAESVLFGSGGKLLGVVVKAEATGSFVATSGRVWVKLTIGQTAHRGDDIYGGNNGVSTLISSTDNYLGICITGSNSNTNLIEILIK